MKRQPSFLSASGLIATVLMLAGLGVVLWLGGGKMFSPGKLSAKSLPGVMLEGFVSHAQFEAECSRCHQPLKTTQDMLCMNCHRRVALQIENRRGTHAYIENVNRCAQCHSDHRGEDFDPTKGAFALFDHSRTAFTLVWHQVDYDTTPIECADCHVMETGNFTLAIAGCISCHGKEDAAFMLQHVQDFGQDCLDCHDGKDRMVGFDHQTTDFPLDGKHANLTCADCHSLARRLGVNQVSHDLQQDLFAQAPRDCVGCHTEPEIHLGMFSTNCVECHNTLSWSPANLEGTPFEHFSRSGFSLVRHKRDYANQPLICNDCHQGSLQDFDIQTCVTCHSGGKERAAFMEKHQGDFGLDCLSCHDGVDRMDNFNHEAFFPLDGRHAEIECEACHKDKVFVGTPKECVNCHEEPKIHAGFFGLKCYYCHTAEAWSPAPLRVHRFPLDHGGEGEVECKICHPGRYVEYTCYGCHEHQPEAITQGHVEKGILPVEIPNCIQCHPTGLKDESH